MQKFLLIMIAVLLWGSVNAQNYLALENAHRFKRIIYYPGDLIKFQTHDGNTRYNGIIESVEDSVIVLLKVVKFANHGDATNTTYRDYVPIREIRTVFPTHANSWRAFRHAYYGSAMVAGGGLIAVTSLNTLIEQQDPDASSLIIASGILVSGLIVRYLGRDKYKLGKKWNLRAMKPMILEEEKKAYGVRKQ